MCRVGPCFTLKRECFSVAIPEQGLLGTQDLHGGGRVLSQAGERASVGDEAGSNLQWRTEEEELTHNSLSHPLSLSLSLPLPPSLPPSPSLSHPLSLPLSFPPSPLSLSLPVSPPHSRLPLRNAKNATNYFKNAVRTDMTHGGV